MPNPYRSPVRPPAVRLSDELGEEAAPVWVQVAAAGSFKGHSAGEFELDAETFAELVDNFRAHPSYDGGSSRVIPWDFHHKSEDHGDPAIAIQGAPAQGWVMELDVREGENGPELWALTDWLEPARTYIREGRYQWASIAFMTGSRDPVTGEECGAYLSSIAITNDPFIQGMQPLAAERRTRRLARIDHALEELRWVFDLDALEGLDTIATKLGELAGMVAGTMPTPAGVNPSDLIDRLRGLLSLPLLTPDAEVVAQTQALVQILAAKIASGANHPPTPPTPIAATRKERTMSKLIALCKAAKLSATVTSEDEAFDALRVHLEASAGANAQLSAILDAIGVEDTDEAMKTIVDLINKAAKLEEAMPQIAELRGAQVEAAKAEDEEDVEETMQAHRLDPKAKPALLAMRRGGVELRADLDDAQWSAALEARAEAKRRFFETYPKVEGAAAHLTTPIATHAPEGGAYRSPLARMSATPYGVSSAPVAPPPAPAPRNGNGDRVTLEQLEACEGANIVEKAIAFVRSTHPKGDALPFDTAHEEGCKLLRSVRASA